jgi:TonB family protein
MQSPPHVPPRPETQRSVAPAPRHGPDPGRASRMHAGTLLASLCLFVAAAALVAAARPDPKNTKHAALRVAAAPGPAARADVARELDRLAALVAEARFRAALEGLNSLRQRLERSDDTGAPERRRDWTRLEILAATVHLALNSTRDADRALDRALIRDPGLELDHALHPPRLLRALEQARRAPRAAERAGTVEASELTRAGDRGPRLLHGGTATAPARAGALHPTVVCRLLVDSTGAVAQAHLYFRRPELDPFERAALETVRDFRFQPAQRAGLPVASWIQWPVRFR